MVKLNHLQNFEVNRSTVRYEKNISLPRFGNFRVLVEIFFRFVIVSKFRIFRKILQKFRQKSKIFEKQKFLSSENFQASVEFLYRIVSYRFFWGRNEMVQWMVEILQVLTISFVIQFSSSYTFSQSFSCAAKMQNFLSFFSLWNQRDRSGYP